jgi:hypothetical protein
MNKTLIKLTLAVLNLSVTIEAPATLMEISFNDGGNNVGSGLIDVRDGYAVSGDFVVTAGLAAGDWTLTGGTPSTAGSGLSPNGYFNYDNIVYLGADPYLTTTGGLLFADGQGDELNLWADSPGTYSLWAVNSNGVYYVEAGSYPGFSGTTGSGTSTITNAPDVTLPSSSTLSIQPTTDGVMVLWPSSGTTYRLLQNPDLTTTNWIPNTNTINVVNGTNQVTITSATGNMFFQLVYP